MLLSKDRASALLVELIAQASYASVGLLTGDGAWGTYSINDNTNWLEFKRSVNGDRHVYDDNEDNLRFRHSVVL